VHIANHDALPAFDVASLGIAGAERELCVIAYRFGHALV